MLRKILLLLLLSTVTVSAQDNSGPRPSCFEVSILPENQPYKLENADQYVVCKDQRITITPTLRAPLRATDTYNVEEISYEDNKWPLTGGTDIQFNTVDQGLLLVILHYHLNFAISVKRGIKYQYTLMATFPLLMVLGLKLIRLLVVMTLLMLFQQIMPVY